MNLLVTDGVTPYRVYNIGNEQPLELLRPTEVLEQCLSKNAIMEMLSLALRHDLSTHDAAYLELALRRQLPIAT